MTNADGVMRAGSEVMEEKGTPLHAACVVGDTVGDPFKDTSSVALNPIIKFTTLFGLLAVEIAVSAGRTAQYIGVFFLIVGLVFVWRSFYAMRIQVAPERVNRELGTATVVITHNAAVAAMADRVVTLHDGRIGWVRQNDRKIPASQLEW